MTDSLENNQRELLQHIQNIQVDLMKLPRRNVPYVRTKVQLWAIAKRQTYLLIARGYFNAKVLNQKLVTVPCTHTSVFLILSCNYPQAMEKSTPCIKYIRRSIFGTISAQIYINNRLTVSVLPYRHYLVLCVTMVTKLYVPMIQSSTVGVKNCQFRATEHLAYQLSDGD